MAGESLTLREHLATWKASYGGGMVPFDVAYQQAASVEGTTVAVAEQHAAHVLLDVFVDTFEQRVAAAGAESPDVVRPARFVWLGKGDPPALHLRYGARVELSGRRVRMWRWVLTREASGATTHGLAITQEGAFRALDRAKKRLGSRIVRANIDDEEPGCQDEK